MCMKLEYSFFSHALKHVARSWYLPGGAKLHRFLGSYGEHTEVAKLAALTRNPARVLLPRCWVMSTC